MKMNRMLVVGSIIALVLVVFNLFFAPKVEAFPTELDLGTICKGEKVSSVLSLRNTGHRTLRILNVDTMCECTTAKADKQELKPGETTKIVVLLDSATLTGKTHRLIAIETNALVNKTILVPLSCIVADGVK